MEGPRMGEVDANSPPQTARSSNAFPMKDAASTLYSYGRLASSYRFALKNTTQTSYVGDHVRQISSNEDWSAMAVSLSSRAVKFYSPATNQFLGECKGHTEDIKHITFSTPHLLHSCSLDGTIRAWDTRTMQQVAVINSGHRICSFSINSEGNLLAAGGESEYLRSIGAIVYRRKFCCRSTNKCWAVIVAFARVLLWDLRTMKKVASLDCHGQATHVLFIPGIRNRLAYASDGAISISDTSRAVKGHDHLKEFLMVDESIEKFGFFGTRNQKLWCYCTNGYVSIWEWRKDELEVMFETLDLFPVFGTPGDYPLSHVDYIIDCHSTGVDDRLWVIAGTKAGTVGHFPVISTKKRFSSGVPQAILGGGHTGKVTCVLPMSSRAGNSHIPQSVFGWTGGEDGKLCCWLSHEASELSRAWISNKVASKSSIGRKCRYNPY